MLKKSFFVSLVGLSLFLSSCGENIEEVSEPTTLCDCIELQLEIMEDTKGINFDDAAMKEIEEKYAEEFEICDQIGKEMEAEFEGLTPQEAEKVQQDMINDCPAYKKLEKIVEEEMQQMQQSMGDIDPNDFNLDDLDLDDLDSDEVEAMIQEELEGAGK